MTRPGGNLTGFSAYEFSIGNKWLDLLKEIAPGLARVGVMLNPDTSPQTKFFMRSIEAAAPSLGVQASATPVRATADIEPAFERGTLFFNPGSAGPRRFGLPITVGRVTAEHGKLRARNR